MPDYRHFDDVMRNRRPARLPIYEHKIDPAIMEQVLDRKFADLERGDGADLREYFRIVCEFFRLLTYDVVSCEVTITGIMGQNALKGGIGPIQNRTDFEQYPWEDIPRLFWEKAAPRFDALADVLPPGMKLAGGVGNGVFELSEAFVGLEFLPYIQADDPDLYADLFRRIGDLMVQIWKDFLPRHKPIMAAARFGDDLGFKSSLLTNPRTVREHILPQYARVIDLVHSIGLPFLWHSCGNIFDIMEDVIALGIDAKHSNEDAIAPFDRWIEAYNDRIGIIGGFDMHFLCTAAPGDIRDTVVREGCRCRAKARGFALGSGNSIPDYVPVANYLAMIEGAQAIRDRED